MKIGIFEIGIFVTLYPKIADTTELHIFTKINNKIIKRSLLLDGKKHLNVYEVQNLPPHIVKDIKEVAKKMILKELSEV